MNFGFDQILGVFVTPDLSADPAPARGCWVVPPALLVWSSSSAGRGPLCSPGVSPLPRALSPCSVVAVGETLLVPGAGEPRAHFEESRGFGLCLNRGFWAVTWGDVVFLGVASSALLGGCQRHEGAGTVGPRVLEEQRGPPALLCT